MWLHLYDKRFLADYKRMYHLVDAFTVLCSGYKQQLARLLSLGADNHIHVISNAEKPVPAEWCNDKKKQVIYSGRLDYFKRVDILLKIWQKIFRKAPDWELVIIGDGPEKRTWKTWLNNGNLNAFLSSAMSLMWEDFIGRHQ